MRNASLPGIDVSLRSARIHTEKNRLIADTGRITRTWKWVDNGFSTTEVSEKTSGHSWKKDNGACDWQMPDSSNPPEAELLSLTAARENDEGFTSDHICATAILQYPAIQLKLSIWVYPDAPGIRTHIKAKLAAAQESAVAGQPRKQGRPPEARIDTVPVGTAECRRRLFGYYNDTQNRNDTHLDILKESVLEHPLKNREFCSWASAICAETDQAGIALVKESHKCVNQRGHHTGELICDPCDGLINTGWGLRHEEIRQDRWTNAWAGWCIAWAGGSLELETAFKHFDAMRYPVDPERDIYIQANTWGSTPSGEEARMAATERPVLKELEACKEIGIDFLQIDDGWQVPPGSSSWDPKENGWHPHPESYPEGWKNVKARAAELGIGLSLWAPALPISEKELLQNFKEAGFRQFKLDFAVLKSRDQIDDLMIKVRNFIAATGHKVRINWDVTEVDPRYGYFFAREYGCIYLANRKPERPVSVIYRPHTNLRDWWQIAKYLNLHRFQCSIQNVDLVNRELSDACLHPHDYVTAAALMGIPLFFQQTQFYSKDARNRVRKVLDAYRPHREAIYRGTVHPIGSKPNNASWTGFQCVVDESSGYMTIFREICSPSETADIKLHGAEGKMIKFTDLITGKTAEYQADRHGTAGFTIPKAPGFIFGRYTIS